MEGGLFFYQKGTLSQTIPKARANTITDTAFTHLARVTPGMLVKR
jgi:hypothetical protein